MALPIGPQTLTPEQRRAVEDPASRILVVASAGSGKTEVLTQRLVRIVLESEGDSFHCLAVTYTSKAAEELRTRIMASAASEAWRLDAETLHAFALDWLRRYGDVVGIGPDVVVYADDADRLGLIQEYLASLGLPDQDGAVVRTLLTAFDQHRTLRPLDAYPYDERGFFGVPRHEIYDAYLEALDAAGGIDFPGMFTKLLEALELDDWHVRNFRSQYRHVVVDEAQDLTPVQSTLLRALVGDDDAIGLFAVADDRQSINGYAGGAFANAQSLVGREAAERPLRLSNNFRSAVEVMDVAESLAQHFNVETVEARPAKGAPRGSVQLVAGQDTDSEAELVVAWVQKLLDEGLDPEIVAEGEDTSITPEQIGILGRTRWTLDPIVQQLERRGIEVSVQVDASGFLSTSEARVAHDALALEANSADAPARRRMTEELQELFGAYYDDGILETWEQKELPSLDPVREMLAAVRSGADLDTTFEALQAEGTQTWAEDADRLRTLWADYRAATTAQSRNLKGFLREVARVQRTRPSDPGVRVATIHRTKGLEYRAVAVVGLREGLIPDYRAAKPEEVDEERRSFYVAITRAARTLMLTWPRITTDRYNRFHPQEPSRFLREAGLL